MVGIDDDGISGGLSDKDCDAPFTVRAHVTDRIQPHETYGRSARFHEDGTMGWSIGFDRHWQRDIGYGVPAFCDHPRCRAEIDRGLSYVCGGEPYGGDRGCGLYFCGEHLSGGWGPGVVPLCSRCRNRKPPFAAKPDHPDWTHHKMTDDSWAEWRAEQGLPSTPIA